MKRFAGILAALVLLVAGTSQAFADHILAADLSWVPAGVNTIRFRGQVYFRTDQIANTGGLGANPAVGNVYCEPIGAGGLRLYYGDGGNSGDLCFRILQVNAIENWVRAIAVLPGAPAADGIVHVYINPGPWNAEILGCCRIDADVNNRVEKSFRLMTTVFANGNNSPVATLGQLPELLVPQACASGEFITFPMLATDPPTNNLAWSVVGNLESTNDATANGPDSEAGFPALSINSATGIVTWYNFGIDNTLPWTVQFRACDATTCTPIDLLLVLEACTFQGTGACTGTQGYWKNHSEAWPVDAIALGANNYTKAQAIALLQTPSKGDKTIDLAHQLIAAKLNVAHGADNSCIQQTISDADAFLILHPIGSNMKGSAWTSSAGPTLHGTLGNYNEGKLCAPHRDSGDCEEGSDIF